MKIPSFHGGMVEWGNVCHDGIFPMWTDPLNHNQSSKPPALGTAKEVDPRLPPLGARGTGSVLEFVAVW